MYYTCLCTLIVMQCIMLMLLWLEALYLSHATIILFCVGVIKIPGSTSDSCVSISSV